MFVIFFHCFFILITNGAVSCETVAGNEVTNGATSSVSCPNSKTLVDCGFEAANTNSDGSSQKGWDGAYFDGYCVGFVVYVV